MQVNPLRLMCLVHCQLCMDTLRQWCNGHPEFLLQETENTGVFEPAAILEQHSDIFLLDLDLPEDILLLASEIRKYSPNSRIVLIGAKWSDMTLGKALSAKINGMLLKSESTPAIFEHVSHVARGEVRISTGLLERLQYDERRNQYTLAHSGPLTSFTNQQLEILRLLACGDSLKMVASKLKLSRKSIDGHKYRIMRKLGISDRVLLSRLAIREGLIQP